MGLQYNRARYYDPKIGRWVGQDPMGFIAGDVNLYRYVGDHPIFSVDPEGLIKVADIRVTSKTDEGYADVPKLGPILGDKFAYGFKAAVDAFLDPGEPADAIKKLKIRQRVYVVAWASPRNPAEFAKISKGRKYYSIVLDKNGKVAFVSDADCDKAWEFWKKGGDAFWDGLFPDISSIKDEVGKPPKENIFETWLFDPDHAWDKDHPDKRIMVGKTFVQWVDAPGFFTTGISPEDWARVSMHIAVQITASAADEKPITARFWIEMWGVSDNKNWSLDSTIKPNPNVNPEKLPDPGVTWKAQ